MKGRRVLAYVYFYALTVVVAAQVEWADYRITEGRVESVLRQTVEPVEGTEGLVRVRTEWGPRSTETIFAAVDSPPRFFSRVTERDGNRLMTTIQFEGKNADAPGTLILLDYDNLFFALRNYPFDAPRPLKVLLLGHQSENSATDSFQVSVQYIGREKMQVAGRSVDCHKLSLVFKLSGVMSVFAPMIPKTYYWYSVEDPHVLVKYVGVNGPPGSPELTRTITAYSRW